MISIHVTTMYDSIPRPLISTCLSLYFQHVILHDGSLLTEYVSNMSFCMMALLYMLTCICTRAVDQRARVVALPTTS